ncbi:MAG: hypothetical protein ACRD04_00740 [Terriglobales bacterium]
MARIAFFAALLGAVMLASCAATNHSAASSASAGKWYLMVPPPMMPPVKDAQGFYKQDADAPLVHWAPFKTFASEDVCAAESKTMQAPSRCVSSTDPALTGNPNLHQPAPVAK